MTGRTTKIEATLTVKLDGGKILREAFHVQGGIGEAGVSEHQEMGIFVEQGCLGAKFELGHGNLAMRDDEAAFDVMREEPRYLRDLVQCANCSLVGQQIYRQRHGIGIIGNAEHLPDQKNQSFESI